MPITLYDHGGHRCLMFTDLIDEGGEAVQSNQFLIVDGDTGAVIDPGGNLAYSDLYLAMTRHFPPSKLSALICSHADPDIIASLDRWTSATRPTSTSRACGNASCHMSASRQDRRAHRRHPRSEGMRIRIGRSELMGPAGALPARRGQLPVLRRHQRDPLLRRPRRVARQRSTRRHSVEALHPLPPGMEAFHQRYMASNKILRLWADMVSGLPIKMIVPQHGAPLVGPAVGEFIAWVRDLPCGIDLFSARNYVLP
jgi:flavorubredoxin